MASKPSPNRRFSILLVLALVHQLGACACGCLEHNSWFQAALACVDHSDHHSHDHAPAEGVDLPLAQHSHSDCGAELVYLSARSSCCPSMQLGLCALAEDLVPATGAACESTSATQLKLLAAHSLAPDVRALSPVLLI